LLALLDDEKGSDFEAAGLLMPAGLGASTSRVFVDVFVEAACLLNRLATDTGCFSTRGGAFSLPIDRLLLLPVAMIGWRFQRRNRGLNLMA